MTATQVDRGSTETTTVYTEGPDLVMERIFDAPRDLVWQVITDPDRINNWWGPHGYTTTVEEMDVRPGGRWRFIQHTTGGEDVPFKGEYLEVVPPERMVQTFIVDVEPFSSEAAISTVTLEDLGGKTKVTSRDRFSSVDSLEGALSTGMTGGALQAWDRLAAELGKSA
jgi:uncharacterized protein YndB with AHSA1/START domain